MAVFDNRTAFVRKTFFMLADLRVMVKQGFVDHGGLRDFRRTLEDFNFGGRRRCSAPTTALESRLQLTDGEKASPSGQKDRSVNYALFLPVHSLVPGSERASL